MDYQRIYNAIISKRKLSPLMKSSSTYTEVHHIIPRCLGGSNSVSNLVRLTAREHFIVHMMLAKVYPDNNGLRLAAYLMCKHTTYEDIKIRSRIYENFRIERTKMVVSVEVRQKMSNARLGKKLSEQHKRNISENNGLKGKVLTDHHRQKISKSNTGKRHSDTAKEKVSIANSGTWLVFHPYGVNFSFKGSLEKFCDINDISCNMMEMSAKNGGVICTQNRRQRTQTAKDTVGWGCKRMDHRPISVIISRSDVFPLNKG